MRKDVLLLAIALILCALAGCANRQGRYVQGDTLAQIRTGFTTHLINQHADPDPLPSPPDGYQLVTYPAPLGQNAAIITSPPTSDGKRYPAIIWLIGGFDSSIDDTPWKMTSPDNDQGVPEFKNAGIVTMYPSYRGGNSNAGVNESFYGEVDDVVAAISWLKKQPYVDPDRIYLGGHSTGGTLALLVDEYVTGLRGVFEFGAVGDMADYGQDNLHFDANNLPEDEVRSPILYLNTIKNPTFCFEGDVQANDDELRKMHQHCSNPLVQFYLLPGLDHFGELSVVTPVIAKQIAADTAPQPTFSFTSQQIVPLN